MPTFLLLYRPGPAWAAGKPVVEPPPPEHARYLLRLYASGQLRFAGPWADHAGAAVVLDVATADEAHEIARNGIAYLDCRASD